MGTRARLHGLVAIALGAAACRFPAASPDGDPPVGVGFQFPTSLTDEKVGTHAVSIALSEPATQTVTVDVEVSGGTADDPADFSLNISTITFTAGIDRADVELSIVDDGAEEENETIELRLANASNALIVHDSHTVTISRDILPRIQFAATTSSEREDAGDQSFEITMNEVSAVDVVVAYAVTGTAVGNPSMTMTDHDVVDGQLTITAGMMSVALPAAITDDPYDEFDETIDLTLTAQVGAVVGANTTHAHTIEDDDPLPQLVFDAGSSSELENGGPTQTLVHVSLVPESGKDVTVTCAVTGGSALAAEYGLANCGALSFPAGTTDQIVAFTPFDDALYENNETVVLQLQSPTNATLGGSDDHTWTMLNDDTAPTIQFAAATSTPAEAVGSYNVSVTQSAVSGLDTTFSITTANISPTTDADHTVNSGPYTIPAGMSSYNVPVAIDGDNIDEPDEAFTLGFTGITNATVGAQTTHVVTIIDDDVKVSFDPTESDGIADELNGSGSEDYLYEVVLDTASMLTVVVNFTATGTAGTADRTVLPNTPLQLTFLPGETSKVITVRVNHDNTGSPGDVEFETVILTLSNTPTNAERAAPFVRTHTIHSEEF